MGNFLKSLLSRKFLSPLVLAVLIFINKKFGNVLTEAQISDVANLILAFVVGEATIDVVRVYLDKKQ